jgi:transcription-repair coupling factor (superfamily II helicase)
MPSTLGGVAVRLLRLADEAAGRGLLHVASSERRADELGRVLRGLAPGLEVLVFPPWDCLPYDRAPPSREAMGRRMAALRQLLRRQPARIVLTVPDALLQRVPPRPVCDQTSLTLRVGEAFVPEELSARLRRLGYVADERVDEAGEMAFLGQVIDLFPPAAGSPYRIEHEDGVIRAIRRYDPATQLTADETEALVLDPASEAIRPGDGEEEDGAEPAAGLEHRLPELYPALETLFDYLLGATIVLEPRAEERRRATLEHVADAYESRTALKAERLAAGRPPLPPARLYLDEEEWAARLAGHPLVRLTTAEEDAEAADAVPRLAAEARPQRAFAAFLHEARTAGKRIVLAAGNERDLTVLANRAADALAGATRPAVHPVTEWAARRDAPEDAILTLGLDLDRGFVTDDAVVIAAPDLLGVRAKTAEEARLEGGAQALTETEFRLGDAVIHMDYGLGRLEGLETLSVGEGTAGEGVRLIYKDEAKLLVPVDELERVWRYGAEGEAVTLDRLKGEAWPKRRAEIEAEIQEAARDLVAAAKARSDTAAEKISPPRRAYERFVARFPFAETPDQARAIEDVLRDLASGRPMHRLVCGDVGYGKTEVALRAAAAAALAGKQVAIVAPTTVLVRQHLNTFRRRFAGTGVVVEQLSRLAKPAEAKRVKAGLADGSIGVVIGTQALAAKGVRFRDLALVVIDEEQRFGTAQKRKLQELASGAHLLMLTATPIPRTLQAASVGLVDLSLIATPPARRQPIRTFVMPFDPVTAREALLRERRRGGQSFVVCPRIDDLAPLAERLAEIAPELEVLQAHGKMPAEAIDETMVRFAEGEGDVLLATNIIESGLDVPRANTMLVWRPDRFGLAQLHQLRGRVGRGRVRGIAYLLTDPAETVAPATRKRLATLETLDRLGAGFAISARDLDLRGAGDLLGEEQAGHVKLIGADLYQHLLGRALRLARGEASGDESPPVLNLGVAGRIPEDYVPEPEVRINLYARLAKLGPEERAAALAHELEDRFGPMPEPVRELILAAEARKLCRGLRIPRVDAGPQAIALTFREDLVPHAAVQATTDHRDGALEWRGERLVLAQPTETSAERLQALLELLHALREADGAA